MAHFLALDVETANADFASLCQIGIVCFDEGRPTWTWQTLLNPEDYFDPLNVSIHGIDEQAVRDAPIFPDVYETLARTLEGRVVVCHTPFDRAAVFQVTAKYGLREVPIRWLDTARVARRAWPEHFARSSYGLASVAAFCGISFEHHRADEDARAAGEVLLRAMLDTGLDLEGWLARVRQGIDPSKGKREGNPDGPLAGEVVAFTGALSMPRREAADMAAEAGCDVGPGVTKKTTLVVVGQQDVRKLHGHEKSSKHRKADKLISEGLPIRIVGEDDFRRLVSFGRDSA